jgi:hypothetical protein
MFVSPFVFYCGSVVLRLGVIYFDACSFLSAPTTEKISRMPVACI